MRSHTVCLHSSKGLLHLFDILQLRHRLLCGQLCILCCAKASLLSSLNFFRYWVASILVPTFEKLSRIIFFSCASDAFGYLEMMVTTVGPALELTASLNDIFACRAVCSMWLTHMRQAFLSFLSKWGMLANKFFRCCSPLASSLFSFRQVLIN